MASLASVARTKENSKPQENIYHSKSLLLQQFSPEIYPAASFVSLQWKGADCMKYLCTTNQVGCEITNGKTTAN